MCVQGGGGSCVESNGMWQWTRQDQVCLQAEVPSFPAPLTPLPP